ncbi:MAG TPA: 50S ribosomal protein L25/general stress protein Ctc [Thiolinea sp.]|nr:50S ribosomal protein L25/general stress protein Ctc [Thiolinea sp.]
MTKQYVLSAELREQQGKGASRRLRRTNGVPAILYGAGKDPVALTLKHNELQRNLQEEAFYSQLITLEMGGTRERVILRDLQRHPSRPFIMHADLQRVKENELLQVHVPLHFINEANSVAVKTQGGSIDHVMSDVLVACLPGDLPEYIEVDMGNVEKGQIIHLSDIKLPEGVSLPELALGEDHNQAIATVH